MPMEAKGTRGERHDAGAAGNRGRGGGLGGGGGRKSDAPPHAGLGGGAVAGLGNPGGGFDPRGGPNNSPFAGMGGLNARRTQNVSPSYQGTLSNFGKMATRGLPGPGMIAGAGLDIAGLRSGFSGFTGNVHGPGDYDPKDAIRSMRPRGGPMSMNAARAAALAPAPNPAAPVGPMPWWRTPFPVPVR